MRSKILIVILFFMNASFAQNGNNAEKVFHAFRDAFNFSNPSLLGSYLADETYLSIKNSYSDYYSKSQVFYILKNFINTYKPIKVKINHSKLNSDTPFAEGVLLFSVRGRQKSAKVFLSLESKKGKFVIAQITID